MTKREKYLSIKRTIREADDISIVFCSSAGPKFPYNQTVKEQEYTISFSSSGRGRLLDADIVRSALEENLGRIRDAIKYLAEAAIYEAAKEALQEAKDSLALVEHEIEEG